MRSAAPYVLAIDLGTTGVKVAVIDGDGAITGAASESFPTVFTARRRRRTGRRRVVAGDRPLLPGRGRRGRRRRHDRRGRGDRAVHVGRRDRRAAATRSRPSSCGSIRAAAAASAARRPRRRRLWIDAPRPPPLPTDDLAHIAVLRARDPEIDANRARRSSNRWTRWSRALVGRASRATATTAFPLMCTDNRVARAYDRRAGRARRRRRRAARRRSGRATSPSARSPPTRPRTSVSPPRRSVMPGTVDSITSAVGGGALEPSRVALGRSARRR